MAGSTFLQLFLFLNVFLIGALAAIAVQHAYAHFRPHRQEPQKPRQAAQDSRLPAEVRQHLLQASQANFQAVLDRSASELRRDLQVTSAQLNKLLAELGGKIVGSEMERYRTQLDRLRQQAETAIGGAQTEIDRHQAELKAKLDEQHTAHKAKLAKEIVAEKQALILQMTTEQQRLVRQIDTKLADAVASFLLETLQHNVDLGAQNAYLVSLLDEHKDEFKREVSNEA